MINIKKAISSRRSKLSSEFLGNWSRLEDQIRGSRAETSTRSHGWKQSCFRLKLVANPQRRLAALATHEEETHRDYNHNDRHDRHPVHLHGLHSSD